MDPAFAKDYERMLKVSELFNSEEEFFQCVRSFIQMEMFIQDDYDDFLKLQTLTLNTVLSMSKEVALVMKTLQMEILIARQ